LYLLVNDSRELVSDVSYKDTNSNGLIDRLEWIVPSLSDQTYELIIEISKAGHLDENHNFISDIYDDVYQLDGIWSEPIYNNEYVRVVFKSELDSSRDITVYARNNQSLNTIIEVYYYNSTEKITEFPIITEEKYYKIYLTNMSGSHDTFDLKIKNLDNNGSAYLEFDHIIDPEIKPVGIELINDSVYHIWNEIDDYYIDKITGVQLTNHYQDYWSHNKWCVYLKLGQWRKVCIDEFDWTWHTDTDNLTYVNLTGTANGRYAGGYEIDVFYEYYLKDGDTKIRIRPVIKNLKKDFDGYLIWRIEDINISMTSENDTITSPEFYWLNETLDLEYDNNVSGDYFRLLDKSTQEYLDLFWDDYILKDSIQYDNNYTLKIKSETGQYNTPIELWSYIGELKSGSEFETKFWWIDGKPGYYPFIQIAITADSSLTINQRENITVHCTITQAGSGTNLGSAIVGYQYRQNSSDNSVYSNTPNTQQVIYTSGNPDTQALGSVGTPTPTDLPSHDINFTEIGTYYVRCREKDTASNNVELLSNVLTVTVNEVLPSFLNPAVNEPVFSGMDVNHSITISGPPDGYIFSWNGTDNCTGGWSNSSWIDVSSSSDVIGYNVSTIPSGCNEKTIYWKFYANNSIGLSESTLQNYSVNIPGTLSVSISLPEDPTEVSYFDTFIINATIKCTGIPGAKCGNVSALARYNETSSPDTAINTTEGATPFYLASGYDGGWVNDTDIAYDLFISGEYSAPAICVNCLGYDAVLISGAYDGNFYASYWNGTQWIHSTSLKSGLLDVGSNSKPAICNNCTGHAEWELISGNWDGGWFGYYWDGDSWVQNTAIVAGLSDNSFTSVSICNNCTGHGFSSDYPYQLFAGGEGGGFSGYYWNATESQWRMDYSMNDGLSTGGSYSASTVYDIGYGKWEFIKGGWSGSFVGHYRNVSSSSWSSDSNVVSGLVSVPDSATPCVCNNCTGHGRWELISGQYNGDFVGYYRNITPSINPKKSTETLELGESWNVTWTVTVGPDPPKTQYLVDVLFSSSYGNNGTINKRICIGTCPLSALTPVIIAL